MNDEKDPPDFPETDPHILTRSTDPKTSGIAAQLILESLPRQYALIRAALRRIKQGNVYDICDATGFVLGAHQIHKRIADMHHLGLTVVVQKADGSDLTKNGPTGRPCRVWQETPPKPPPEPPST